MIAGGVFIAWIAASMLSVVLLGAVSPNTFLIRVSALEHHSVRWIPADGKMMRQTMTWIAPERGLAGLSTACAGLCTPPGRCAQPTRLSIPPRMICVAATSAGMARGAEGGMQRLRSHHPARRCGRGIDECRSIRMHGGRVGGGHPGGIRLGGDHFGGTDTGGLAWLFSCGIAFVRQARDLPRITTPARRDYGEFADFG